jgi:hypothetical protein
VIVFKKSLLALMAFALMAAISAIAVYGQTAEVKEKPRMYTYVADWVIPRSQWADMDKVIASTQTDFEKAFADGTLVGYGDDTTLVHHEEGNTNDTFWSSMSLGGLIKVLEQVRKSANPTAPPLSSATKHWDNIYVSRYYNWKKGSWKGLYTYESAYKLKADAPDDAVDQLSKNLVVPLLEKMLADGTIVEYEIDTQAVHTEAPGLLYIVYIGATADALDKVNAAIRESFKANPLGGPAFASMVESSQHRDEVARTNATYK